jgi:hypothetical protein
MEAAFSSETYLNFPQTTREHFSKQEEVYAMITIILERWDKTACMLETLTMELEVVIATKIRTDRASNIITLPWLNFSRIE